MHTEHLYNVRIVWLVSGWLVAVAITSLITLVLASLELIATSLVTSPAWLIAAVAAGFAVGGFSIGYRAAEAPILHGIGIGLTSLVAWFVLNLAFGLLPGRAEWEALSPTLTAALLLLQMAAAVAGAWVGHNLALRGKTEIG